MGLWSQKLVLIVSGAAFGPPLREQEAWSTRRDPENVGIMVLELGTPTDADADEIASLHLLSFDSNVLLHAQFPTPQSLKGLQGFLSQDAIRDLQDPGKTLMVVRDSETSRIVSFAKWDLPAPAKHHADVTWPDGCQQRLLDEYYEKAEAEKKRLVGDTPCYCKKGSFSLRSHPTLT